MKCLNKKNASSPEDVLKRLEKYLTQNRLKSTDEAWLAVDKDKWSDSQLEQLYNWSQSQENYGFAVSNPKFEYWLLLHFEDGVRITSPRDCSRRLDIHLPDYDKNVKPLQFTQEMIQDAIDRAKRHDSPPCEDWPRTTGTTVYLLAEKLLGQ